MFHYLHSVEALPDTHMHPEALCIVFSRTLFLVWLKQNIFQLSLKCLQFSVCIMPILLTKANWIGRILRRNCLFHDGIEGQMTEVKGIGRRRTQLLDDLRNRRRYWELKEEAEDRITWKRQFITRT